MYLRETMVRISRAIQVLEELLADDPSLKQNGAHSDEKQSLSSQVNPGNILVPHSRHRVWEVTAMDQDRTAQRWIYWEKRSKTVAWELTSTAGTDPATNFLGTTDHVSTNCVDAPR